MNLQINLATRVYVNTRRLRLTIGGLGILLLCWLFANIKGFVDNMAEIDQLMEKSRLIHQPAPSKEVQQKDYQQLMTRIQFVNGLLKKRAFDWLSLLDHLEAVVPEGVALTAIQPGKGGELKLSGNVRQFANIQRFMESLESSKVFTEVFLVSQAETQVATDKKGISFLITCKATF